MELPRLEPIWKKYREAGLKVVAIDTYAVKKEAQKFIKEKGLTFDFLETKAGPKDPVREIYDVKATPMNFVVDAEGRILFVHVGYKEGDEKEIEEMVKAALEM